MAAATETEFMVIAIFYLCFPQTDGGCLHCRLYPLRPKFVIEMVMEVAPSQCENKGVEMQSDWKFCAIE